MSEVLPPKYNLNPDGSFMDASQIADDIIANRLDPEFAAELITDRPEPAGLEGLNRVWSMQSFGRWIRNSYGLWDQTHPIYLKWMAEQDTYIKKGVDYSPHHPDNYSGTIMDMVIARLKGTT